MASWSGLASLFFGRSAVENDDEPAFSARDSSAGATSRKRSAPPSDYDDYDDDSGDERPAKVARKHRRSPSPCDSEVTSKRSVSAEPPSRASSPGKKTKGPKKTNSRKQTPKRSSRSPNANDDDDDDDADWAPSRIPEAEKADLGINDTIERDDHADRSNPIFAKWTDDEIKLFNRLADRGAEPLLPSSWMMDFPTMPEQLFTEDDDKTFINSLSDKEFNATDALNKLLIAGTRVKCQIESGLNPAPLLSRAINAYLKWALKDGGDLSLAPLPPPILIATARPSESVAQLLARMTAQFRVLAAQYRNSWTARRWPLVGGPEYRNPTHAVPPTHPRPLPTLYGIVLTKAVMTFVSFRSDLLQEQNEDKETALRHLALFDWADAEQSVWNAFAVAILVITVRDYLVDLDVMRGVVIKESGMGERGEAGSDDDPDA